MLKLIIGIAFALQTLPGLRAYTALPDASTGRIYEEISTGIRTVKSNSGSLSYVGNTVTNNNVYVLCFQMPDYPAGDVIDSATLKVFINTINNNGGTLGNASIYGVRTSSSAGIQTSDYTGGVEVASSVISSSLGTGYFEMEDTGATPLVNWLATYASPNEYVILRIQTDSPQATNNCYKLSDESVSGEAPSLEFTAVTPAPTDYDASVHTSTGRIYKDISTGSYTVSSNCGTLGYVGRLSSVNSVFVLCFQMPDYPEGSQIVSADLSVFINTIANTNGTLSPASIYGVRASSSPGIQGSDYEGGVEVVSEAFSTSNGTGYVNIDSEDPSDLVDWLDANAAPNEYVILRIEPDAQPDTYHSYKISDDTETGYEPLLSIGVIAGSGGGSGGGGGSNPPPDPDDWGTVAWNPAPWQRAQGVTWESMDDLEDEIAATASGGTLDLTGRFFRATPGAPRIYLDQPINIVGGYFSAATSLTWTSIGGGLYSASLDLDLALGANGLANLEDPDADTPPLMAVFPEPPAGVLSEHRLAVNENWWVLKDGDDTGGVFTEGSINNGTIHTQGGDNAVDGSLITGFTITGAALRSEVDAAIDGEAGSLLVLYHAGANLVGTIKVSSWNSTTGTLTFATPGMRFPGYFEFAFSGRPAFINGEDNTYVFDFANDEVVYKPTDGDPAGTGAGAIPQFFRVSSSGVSFTDCVFSGSNSNSSAAGFIGSPSKETIILDGCVVALCTTGIREVVVDADLCHFSYIFSRALAVLAGSTITRSRFEHIEESSAILVQSSTSATETMPLTTIEGCLFYLPSSIHGQGISLYTNTWQNAVVRNNIFFNCDRALSFQPSGGGVLVPGVLHIENNLIWTTELAIPDSHGQATVAFNGASDTHLPYGEQDVYIRHNIIGAADDTFYTRTYTVSISKLRHSNVWIDGNIAGTISASTDTAGYTVHQHSRNLLGGAFGVGGGVFPAGYGAALGETDLANASSATVFDRTNIAAIGTAATAAYDGGPVGIRWLAVPDATEIPILPLDWVDVVLPQALPSLTDWSDAYFNTDDR